MSDVYVMGVDMIKFGRFPDRSVPNIGAEAALMALDDAGLGIQDMQALYCGNLGQANAMVGQRILQEIGQTGMPVVNVANACATGATAFREAWMSIKAGMYDVVLAVGVEQMGKGLLGGAGGGDGIPKEGLLLEYHLLLQLHLRVLYPSALHPQQELHHTYQLLLTSKLL